jgi:hypothetical protein
MKVKELIEKLQTVDPELYVFVDGYEGGYDYLEFDPKEKNIALNVHEEWYYGRHDKAVDSSESVVKAIILARTDHDL